MRNVLKGNLVYDNRDEGIHLGESHRPVNGSSAAGPLQQREPLTCCNSWQPGEEQPPATAASTFVSTRAQPLRAQHRARHPQLRRLAASAFGRQGEGYMIEGVADGWTRPPATPRRRVQADGGTSAVGATSTSRGDDCARDPAHSRRRRTRRTGGRRTAASDQTLIRAVAQTSREVRLGVSDAKLGLAAGCSAATTASAASTSWVQGRRARDRDSGRTGAGHRDVLALEPGERRRPRQRIFAARTDAVVAEALSRAVETGTAARGTASPTRAYAEELKTQSSGEVMKPPCGPYGESPDGIILRDAARRVAPRRSARSSASARTSRFSTSRRCSCSRRG